MAWMRQNTLSLGMMRPGYGQAFIFFISLFILLLLVPRDASGEFFFDLYGGSANTRNTDVTASYQFIFVPPSLTTETRRVDFDSSTTFGLRSGYWFDGFHWFGLAGDISYFQADAKDVDINIIPFSALLMFRYPILTSDEFPHGRLQPYAGIGFAWFVAEMSVDFRPTVADKVDGYPTGTGPDYRLGLAWQLNRNIAIYGEYRYTRVDLDMDEEDDFDLFFEEIEEADAEIETTHLLFGVSFRF